ncbi:hypothetical protein Esti_006206 [Eimeria stiedai]
MVSFSLLRASRPAGFTFLVLLLCLITTVSPGSTLTNAHGSSRVVAAAASNRASGRGQLRRSAVHPGGQVAPLSVLERGAAAALASPLYPHQHETRFASSPSFTSVGAAQHQQHARRRGRQPAAAESLLEADEEQQWNETGRLPSSLVEKSVTSTRTPSAFTVSDPFAAWTVHAVASPKSLPVEQPTAPASTNTDQGGEGTPEAQAAAAGPAEAPQEEIKQHTETKREPQAAEAAATEQQSDAAAAGTPQQADAAAAAGATAAPESAAAGAAEQRSGAASSDEQLAAAKAAAEKAALEAAAKGETEKLEDSQRQEALSPTSPQPSSSSFSDAARAQRRSAATHGGGTLEKALAQKVENVKLTEQETKDFVDTKEVAKNVRRLVGIKAGSNLHLENEKLIKPGCDIATFGPAYCASEDNPRAADILWSLENRKNNTYFVIALCMLAFAILVQCSCRVLERKVIRGGDQFSREVMETAFRQIAYIAIVDVILWGCMQSNVAEILDELIFGDVMPQHRDADIVLENVSPMLEVLFEELFFVAILLLIWYVVFVVLLQCLVRQLASWMRKVDEEEDVTTIARRAEAAQTSTCGSCLKSEDIAKARFVAHRYEFGDNVQTMSIPGIDPSGYYFMEYMRASLMQMAIKMLRLPNSTLVLLMVVAVVLRPFLSFRVHPEAALLSVCSFACLLGMLLTWAYVKCIERQLLPRRLPHYLVMRYHMEVSGDGSAEYLEEYTPPYKLKKQKSAWPGVCSRYFYGTTLPNKHQQLFCFWANGPNIVMRALEASYFCQLLVLAWWVQLLRCHPATWLRISWWGNVAVGVCALLHFGLLKHVLHSTLIALHSGMLVNNELLEKVWEIQRAENVRRTAELVDGLRVQSTLFAISEGGEMFWKQMKIKKVSTPPVLLFL